ncbi:MAG TPA: ATP-dependent DNA helicase [Lachnospiraceae bacterium]|nr:ATP-dependent DNA helicase [Lachnospiraceae bacterium]
MKDKSSVKRVKKPEKDAKPVIKISVRGLVEFILRSGDIDTRTVPGRESEAMLAGGRAHRRIQKGMSGNYQSEVTLADEIDGGPFTLRIEGRADGIFSDEPESYTVDEIKGMYLDTDYLDEPFLLHLAQAKCYACIFLMQKDLPRISVRMTYVNLDSGKIRYFHFSYSSAEIKEWYSGVTGEFMKWAAWSHEWAKRRNASMEELTFPFPYRKGQQKLVASVYHSIKEGKELFLMAPTGVGKTMSAVYPSVRAVGEGTAGKIFYITAKNQTLSVGMEAFSILSENGLKMKITLLTAKEKICPMNEPVCNPDACPYAKGHFDRINDAVFELLQDKNLFDRDAILAEADRRKVCPFELSLDLASWSDVILGDYNYVFDPDAALKRFFGEGIKGDYIFLIDEAHNLVERARKMYSASLVKEHVLLARKILKGGEGAGRKALKDTNSGAEKYADNTIEKDTVRCIEEAAGRGAEKGGKSLRGRTAKALEAVNRQLLLLKRTCDKYEVLSQACAVRDAAERALSEMEDLFKEEKSAELKESLLEFYFELRNFAAVSGEADDDYVIYTEINDENEFILHYFCVNPARALQLRIDKGKCAVFFSATLLPIAYYKNLLSTREDNYAVYAESPFEDSQKLLLIGRDVSTRYRDRGEALYRRIARYIHDAAASHKGNYMAFFPSYKFMEDVLGIYRKEFDEPEWGWVAQNRLMREDDREIFLENFYEDPKETFVGFCVMGGMFAEGIDLTGTRLIGAVIVGCGLPQVSNESEILKNYYDEKVKDGFSYAYINPGMNKVLQSAGRVIRTAKDRGVILLLDDRFLSPACQSLFPREWRNFKTCRIDEAGSIMEEFWRNAPH